MMMITSVISVFYAE